MQGSADDFRNLEEPVLPVGRIFQRLGSGKRWFDNIIPEHIKLVMNTAQWFNTFGIDFVQFFNVLKNRVEFPRHLFLFRLGKPQPRKLCYICNIFYRYRHGSGALC